MLFSAILPASLKNADIAFLPSSTESSDIIASPLFLNPVSGKPSVVIVLDRSRRMFEHVYDLKRFDTDSVDGRMGYFQANVQYRYDSGKQLFIAEPQLSLGDTGAWDGRFLNWLTLKRIDLAMLLLYGGQSIRNDKSTATNEWRPLTLNRDKSLPSSRVQIRNSADYSPVHNNQVISIINNHIVVGGLIGARYKIALQTKGNKNITSEGLLNSLRERVNFYLFDPDLKRLILGSQLGQHIEELFLKVHDTPFRKTYTEIFRIINAMKPSGNTSINPYYDAPQLQELGCKRVIILHVSASALTSVKEQDYQQDCKVKLSGKQWVEPFQVIMAPRVKREGRDLVEGHQYWADQLDELEVSLQSDIRTPNDALDLSKEIKTGATLANGMLLQASYFPQKTGHKEKVYWTGELSALMTDGLGRIRSDNGDKKIGALHDDPIVDTCHDKISKHYRVKFSSSEQERPSLRETEMCSELVYTKRQEDIGYLWQAGKVLSQTPYFDVSKQREYSSPDTSNRYIRTQINNRELDFLPSTFSKSTMGILNTTNINSATHIVNFIRGEDQPTMRSRKFKGQTERLGDFINSQPIVVGQPAENYFLLYGDLSYLAFYKQYRDRRRIAYIGGNDGLLHGFNAGWFDEINQQHLTNKADHAQWLLGQEIWAFVPFNLLPHLKYLSRKAYGKSASDHLFLMDQTPYVFDAQIFGEGQLEGQDDRDFVDAHGVKLNDVTHPNGWGTVMVVGFGRGGSVSEVVMNPTEQGGRDKDNVISIRPSYLVFDITDPEQAPRLLTEFSHDKLLSSRSVPTVMTTKADDGALSWQLLIGSGPNIQVNKSAQLHSEQSAHLLMLDLKTMRLNKNFGEQGVMKLDEPRAYVGGLAVADFDLDALTDAVYFGTTSNTDPEFTPVTQGGKLFSLRINNNEPNNGRFYPQEMINARRPIQQRPIISTDKNANRWLHFGTGSIQTTSDLISQPQNRLYGIKESRYVNGDFKMDHHISAKTIQLNDLVDVSRAEVNALSGSLKGVSIMPALKNDHVVALDKRLQGYDDSSVYHSGWFKTLTPSEYAVGESTLLGGFYFQNAYSPDRKNCRLGGGFTQYRLKHTTGTSWFNVQKPKYGQARSDSLKQGLQTARPLESLLHLGELRIKNQMNMLNLSSEGPIYVDEISVDNISSQVVGWCAL